LLEVQPGSVDAGLLLKFALGGIRKILIEHKAAGERGPPLLRAETSIDQQDLEGAFTNGEKNDVDGDGARLPDGAGGHQVIISSD
jgi:hypothetical protein